MAKQDLEVDPDHRWQAEWQAVKLIGPCREVARVYGYAIGEHGSKRRDIDWIAVPWVDDPASPRTLVEAIAKRVGEINRGMAYMNAHEYAQAGHPGDKPQGRLTWTIHLGGGPYIDISVVPPR
jgi:hypothetical protein